VEKDRVARGVYCDIMSCVASAAAGDPTTHQCTHFDVRFLGMATRRKLPDDLSPRPKKVSGTVSRQENMETTVPDTFSLSMPGHAALDPAYGS
jgi:hypothetical protein